MLTPDQKREMSEMLRRNSNRIFNQGILPRDLHLKPADASSIFYVMRNWRIVSDHWNPPDTAHTQSSGFWQSQKDVIGREFPHSIQKEDSDMFCRVEFDRAFYMRVRVMDGSNPVPLEVFGYFQTLLLNNLLDSRQEFCRIFSSRDCTPLVAKVIFQKFAHTIEIAYPTWMDYSNPVTVIHKDDELPTDRPPKLEDARTSLLHQTESTTPIHWKRAFKSGKPHRVETVSYTLLPNTPEFLERRPFTAVFKMMFKKPSGSMSLQRNRPFCIRIEPSVGYLSQIENWSYTSEPFKVIAFSRPNKRPRD